MRLPDFLIIGAQKSGTSWLAKQLRAHSHVFMPPGELHFFDHPDLYARGPAWYAEHFEAAGPDRLAGEKTPNYLFLPDDPDVPQGHRRIAELLPSIRQIAILRDPVTRAVSALNHVIRDGLVSPLYSADRLLGADRHRVPWPVLEFGFYARQLAAFFEVFDRDRVLVLYYEDDIRNAPEHGVRVSCQFLGIEPELDSVLLEKRANTRRHSWLRLAIDRHVPVLSRWTARLDHRLPSYYAKPSEDTLKRLYDYYAPHNDRLFDMLGRRPSSGWRYVPPGEREAASP